jgi:hypothetical protein
MRPTLRERLRWWRWAFTIPGPAQFMRWPGKYPDRRTRDLIYERHDAEEPWPRVRHDRWVYEDQQDDK